MTRTTDKPEEKQQNQLSFQMTDIQLKTYLTRLKPGLIQNQLGIFAAASSSNA